MTNANQYQIVQISKAAFAVMNGEGRACCLEVCKTRKRAEKILAWATENPVLARYYTGDNDCEGLTGTVVKLASKGRVIVKWDSINGTLAMGGMIPVSCLSKI